MHIAFSFLNCWLHEGDSRQDRTRRAIAAEASLILSSATKALENVNAVGVGIDHPLDSPHLAFSTPKPLEQIVFICGVPHHVRAFPLYPHRVSHSMALAGDRGQREALFRALTLGERGSVGAKFTPIGVDFPYRLGQSIRLVRGLSCANPLRDYQLGNVNSLGGEGVMQ